MMQPGRTYEVSDSYRYSLNGQEKTPEISQNSTTAEFWQYDTRIARRWNVDPVLKEYESPYLVFSGNPVSMGDPNGDDPKPKGGPYHNPKARRSVNKYRRLFEKELKRLGGNTEENREKATAYMNKYDVKKWMWIRHTSLEHMPIHHNSDNIEIFYNAGNLFDIEEWEKYKAIADKQPMVPLARIGGGVVPSFEDGDDMANYHTYRMPEGASGDVILRVNATKGSTWRVQAVQNNKERPTQAWSFYFEPQLFGPENISGPKTLGPVHVDAKNGRLIHVVVNVMSSPMGGSEFSDRGVQPYMRRLPPGPKIPEAKLRIFQSRQTQWGNRRRLDRENMLHLLLQKYKH